MSVTDGYERRGSWTRGLWLWLSSSAVAWVLWGLMWAVEFAVNDHSTDEFWPLALYFLYVAGTIAFLAINAVIWFTIGRLVDVKARTPWPWYILIGAVLGGWLAIGLRDANPYALIAGLGVIAAGGYGIGPWVAGRTFESTPWRIGVGVTMGLGIASVVGAML